MCLLVLAWQAHPRYRLIVAANRDEYHERPAAPLSKWPPPASLIAGRDLRAGGTWLGLDRERRFGAVTNFRELQRARPEAPSRGELIPRYLKGGTSAAGFFASLETQANRYSGFNLLITDRESLWYGCNRNSPFARALPAGVYGLSNEVLDTPWPKLQRVRHGFETWLKDPGADPEALFTLLADRTRVADEAGVPATGLPRAWEEILSSPFVLNAQYGTRCSSVLMLEPEGGMYLAERRFDAQGDPQGQTEFRLNGSEWP
jgi:uncharacterized protein with NRDE domain